MKPLIIFLLFSTITITSYCQPAVQWNKAYGSTAGSEAFYRVLQTNDGGYIAIGNATVNGGDVNGHKDTPPTPGSDVWIVKTNATGAISWAKCYGGSAYDIGYWIEQTRDNGYIFCGETRSNDGDVSGNHGVASLGDAWVVKLDDTGKVQWQKCLGGTASDRASCVRQTKDGGYIVAAHAASNDGDISSPKGSTDAFIVKLKANGDIDWAKNYGGTKSESISCVLEATDGSIIVTGSSSSSDGDLAANKGGNDAWVLKLNATGTVDWSKNIGGLTGEIFNSIVEVPSTGALIFSGSTASSDGDISANKGGNDVWMVSLNSSGSIQWSKTFGGAAADNAYQSVLGVNNTILVVGSSSSTDGDVSGNKGIADIWLMSVKLDGTLEWQKSIGGTRTDLGFSIARTVDYALVLSGTTTSTDGDAAASGNHSTNNTDGWIIKLEQHSGIKDVQDNKAGIVVYPTITTGNINVKLPEGNHHATIKMTDMLGREVPVSYQQSGNHVDVALGMLPPSIYLLHVVIDNGTSTYKVEYRP